MAKTTKFGGPSYVEDSRNIRIRRPMLGEVDRPSVGSNSEASSEREPTELESPTQVPLSPAPVESPFNVEPTEPDLSARSTGGSGRKTTQQQSGRKPAKKTTGRVVRSDDEFS